MSNKVWVTWKLPDGTYVDPTRVIDLGNDSIVDDLRRNFVEDRRGAEVDAATLSVFKKEDGEKLKVGDPLQPYFTLPPGSAAIARPGQSMDTALFVTFQQQPNGGGNPPRPQMPQALQQSRSEALLRAWSQPLDAVPSIKDLPAAVSQILPAAIPYFPTLGTLDRPATDVIDETKTCSDDTILLPALDQIRSSIYTLRTVGDTEDCVHSVVDALILRPVIELTQYQNCTISTNRNGVDSTGATVHNLRPDVLIWLPSGVLAFKGEDKASSRQLQDARNDLLKKMAVFTDAFFGNLPYQLCYAAAGHLLEFWAIDRYPTTAHARMVQLTQPLDLRTTQGRSLCVRYAVNIAKLLTTLNREYPEGSVARLGDSIQTLSSTVHIFGDYVLKYTNTYTGQPAMESLYRLLLESGNIPGLIRPNAQPGFRRGKMTVNLSPVGFCGRAPTSVDEVRSAARSILSALAWLHVNGWVHRDIRKANIMYSDGQWYLIDVEWANEIDQPTGEYHPVAMPPEIRGNSVWSGASDMWQFGKILQEWGHLNENGQALVRVLLCDDPTNRLSASSALQHDFFGE